MPAHPSSDRTDVLATVDVPELLERCDAGDQAACLELDRRGIEPPLLELDPPCCGLPALA